MSVINIIMIYAVCFLPLMILFALMPYIGRRTLCFGISIPSCSYDDPQLQYLRKRFASGVVWIGLALAAISIVLFFLLSEATATIVFIICIFLYIALICVLFVRSWKAAGRIKQQRGWRDTAQQTAVADTQFSHSKRSVSAAWFLIYGVIIALTLILGILLYDKIPGTVPMQTNMSGQVTRTVEKSFNLILFAPALQAFIALLMGLVYWIMLRTPAVIDPDNLEKTSQQNTIFRYRWSAFIVFGGMLIMLMFLSMQLGFAQVLSPALIMWIPLGSAALLVAAAIVLSIKTGQSGSRVRLGKTATGAVINRDDDKYWKWGSFYVNKDDPALFAEKRFGIGSTVNFGRPAAVLIFVGIMVLIAAIAIVSVVLTS